MAAPKKVTFAKLPIPTLRDTLDRYLTSIEPFLREDERHGGQPFATAYAIQEKIALEWEHGLGKTVQGRLTGRQNFCSTCTAMEFNLDLFRITKELARIQTTGLKSSSGQR